MKKSDEKFVQDAKTLFDDSVEELDGATLSTLNQGRHRALAELQAQPAPWLRWAPAAGMATAALVVAMIIVPEPTEVDMLPATAVTDMDILLGEDSIEMLEDLEFYAWLDAIEANNDVG